MGLITKSPPQFGQSMSSLLSAHSAWNAHSKVQIRAVLLFGGRSLSQHSQFGRNSSIGILHVTVEASSRPLGPLHQRNEHGVDGLPELGDMISHHASRLPALLMP